MVDLCQLPPLPVESNDKAGGTAGCADDFVAGAVVAAVVTGGIGERFIPVGAEVPGEEEDFAGWRSGGRAGTVSPPAVAEAAGHAACLLERTPAACRGEVPAVVPSLVVERRCLRPAPPLVARNARSSPTLEAVEQAGRFSSPLVLLGSAAVSMVLLSLASIGMVRDIGSLPVPSAEGRIEVPAKSAVAEGSQPAAAEAPAIAGSEEH